MKDSISDISERVYEQLLAQERMWRIDNELIIPSLDRVHKITKNLIDYVQKSQTSISIEQGGILVKNSDGHIDVYVYAGEV